MNNFPEDTPEAHLHLVKSSPATPLEANAETNTVAFEPSPEHHSAMAAGNTPEAEGRSFRSVLFDAPPPPPPERIPNLAHVGILILLGTLGLFCSILLARAAIAVHLFGVSTIAEAAGDIHYTLGTEGLLYLLTLAPCLLLFPHLWGKGFFDGLQWQAGAAWQRRRYLFGAAAACFILALFNGYLLPGPSDAPIDKIFRMPGAAWGLFVFGVTFAPFFEELAFRGFLLPALSTAFDWSAERATGRHPHTLDRNGHPQWSMPAMIAASIFTSLLFALLHAEQTGTTLHSLGPFLLLFCVSLVLCGIRLLLRSLAASVLVHATYNFLLFSLMFLGTAGFRHLDKM
ncbi:MAG TPA: CPBP family intramembrane glutamic endopeptidase [Terracidiphilus sp.]|jgi:membrane protease YdiL (CAAX protease family)|nr:CPBP family intramembrane glutamic endopeptidase [Terracidiphilus sp.]